MGEAMAFSGSEHVVIGNRAFAKYRNPPSVSISRSQFTNKLSYSLTFGELVAMAGDYLADPDFFESPDPLSGNFLYGTAMGQICYMQEELKTRTQSSKCSWDDFDKSEVTRRFLELAAKNWSHYLNSDGENFTTNSQNVHYSTCEEVEKSKKSQPNLYPLNSEQAYVFYHCRAISLAEEAAIELKKPAAFRDSKRSFDHALVYEAFADHFLSDSFSSGHLRVKRYRLSKIWNSQVPMFQTNFINYSADSIRTYRKFTPNKFMLAIPQTFFFTMKQSGTGEYGFGDYLSGSIHDRDNALGLEAQVMVSGKITQLHLMGDDHLITSSKMDPYYARREGTLAVVVEAVSASIAEIYDAFQGTKNASRNWQEGTFKAQRMLPLVLPDSAQPYLLPNSILDGSDKTANVNTILQDEIMKNLLAEYARRQANMLTNIIIKNEHFEDFNEAVIKKMKLEPEDFLYNVANYIYKGVNISDVPTFADAVEFYFAALDSKAKNGQISFSKDKWHSLQKLTDKRKNELMQITEKQKDHLGKLTSPQRSALCVSLIFGWRENTAFVNAEMIDIDASTAPIAVLNLLITASEPDLYSLLRSFGWLEIWRKFHDTDMSLIQPYAKVLGRYFNNPLFPNTEKVGLLRFFDMIGQWKSNPLLHSQYDAFQVAAESIVRSPDREACIAFREAQLPPKFLQRCPGIEQSR